MQKIGNRFWGILASSLCTIHCMATPLFFSTMPNFVPLGHNHGWLTVALMLPSFAIWYFVFYKNQRLHGSWIPSFLFAGSIIAQAVADAIFHFPLPLEIGASLVTAVVILVAFTIDSKESHKHAACAHGHKH